MLLCLALVLIVLLSVLRIALQLLAIDPATGFYMGHSQEVLMQNLLFIVGLLLLILLSGGKRFWQASKGQEKVMGFLLCAGGIALGAASLWELAELILDLFSWGGGLRPTLAISRLLALASSGALIYVGAGLLSGGGFARSLSVYTLPALWAAIGAVDCFLSSPTIASISDQVLEVLTLCMGAIFWLSHARFAAGGELSFSSHRGRASGLLFSLFALPFSLGRMASLLMGRTEEPILLWGDLAALALLGIYAFYWSFCFKREARVG